MRCSKKKTYLKYVSRLVKLRIKSRLIRCICKNQCVTEDLKDRELFMYYIVSKSKRYLFRKSYRKQDKKYWKRFLDPCLTYDTEFLMLFRMTRNAFLRFARLMKTNSVFYAESGRGRPQFPVILQLLVFFFTLECRVMEQSMR